MALTAAQLQIVGRFMERYANTSGAPVNWTRPQLEAAANAVDLSLVNALPSLRADIETAAPTVFTAAVKAQLVQAVINAKGA